MSQKEPGARPQVFTLGHAGLSQEAFVGLLKARGIEVLVDVRPEQSRAEDPDFDGPILRVLLACEGIKYLFLGREIAGPTPAAGEDGPGVPGGSSSVEGSPEFLGAVARLERGVRQYRVALMGREESAANDPRRRVERALAEREITVHHLRGEARVERKAAPGDGPLAEFARLGGGGLASQLAEAYSSARSSCDSEEEAARRLRELMDSMFRGR